MKKEAKSHIPKVKKTINAFLVGEDGKISKQSIIKAGVVLGAVSLGALKGVGAHGNHSSSTPHTNNPYALTTGTDSASSSHKNHANHGSHSNHSNHSNHGSHSSGGSGSDSDTNTHSSHGSHGSCGGGKWCGF